MLTQTDIIAILTSPPVNQINFCLNLPSGVVRVYPQGYHTIADRIRSGAIALESTTDLPPNVSAFFRLHWPRTPAIVTNAAAAITSLEDRMTIIHECTHALLHYNGTTPPSVVWSELTCFIAEAVYLEASDFRASFARLGDYHSIQPTAQRVVAGTLYDIPFNLEISRLEERVRRLYRHSH
jgi:hypothetical protein